MDTREQNCIVLQSEILSEEQVRAERVGYVDLKFNNQRDCIQWLAKRALLCNSMTCDHCQVPLVLSKCSRIGDGVRWRCKQCTRCVTIRKKSFFSKSSLPLDKLVVIIYGWSMNYQQNQIMHESKVCGRNTLMDWCSFCRDICQQFFMDNPITLGGLNEDFTAKVVEIGESKYFRRKYNRGRWREGHWIFGGIERGTENCFLVEAPDRTRETLEELIKTYILPGTIIMSDGSRAYHNLGDIDGGIYEHRVISLEQHFVDPADKDVHIQNIENMWMRAKKKLCRQFCSSEALFRSYFDEFMWRNKFRHSNCFAEFIICVKKQYRVHPQS